MVQGMFAMPCLQSCCSDSDTISACKASLLQSIERQCCSAAQWQGIFKTNSAC